MGSLLEDLVRRLLWEEWDPMNLRQHGGPDDEYDSYVKTIVRLLHDGCDEHRMTQHLSQLESNAMGLKVRDEYHIKRVARLLIELYSPTNQKSERSPRDLRASAVKETKCHTTI